MRKRQKAAGFSKRPIGVFDSGLGGLTVVREIRKQLPQEAIVYFGDLAHLPYGTKSKRQITRYSVQSIRFLLRHRVKAVVVACNSASSAAFRYLKNYFSVPLLDVLRPAVEQSACVTKSGRVGVIATQATIDSGAYEKNLKRVLQSVSVFTKACPLFVPLVESAWSDGRVTDQIIRAYLAPVKARNVDTLILGCTHYPLLKSRIQRFMGSAVKLVDSAQPTVRQLTALLREKGLSRNGKKRGKLRVYVNDQPRNFKRIGERFLGESLRQIRVVSLD